MGHRFADRLAGEVYVTKRDARVETQRRRFETQEVRCSTPSISVSGSTRIYASGQFLLLDSYIRDRRTRRKLYVFHLEIPKRGQSYSWHAFRQDLSESQAGSRYANRAPEQYGTPWSQMGCSACGRKPDIL